MVPESEKLKGKKRRATICYVGRKEATNSDWVFREGLGGKILAQSTGLVFTRATVY